MRFTLPLLAATASVVLAQSPPGFPVVSNTGLPATFSNSTPPTFFLNGGLFSRDATQVQPRLYLPPTYASDTLLVLMIDPDAPSPQNQSFGPILHWLEPGIRLNLTAAGFPGPRNLTTIHQLITNTSNAIAPYIGPAPPSTAPHRYIIHVFRQPADFSLPAAFQSIVGGANRRQFNAAGFISATGLGSPIAVTYFLVGNGTVGDGTSLYTGTDAAPGVPTGTRNATTTTSLPRPTSVSNDAEKLGASAIFGLVFGAMYYLA